MSGVDFKKLMSQKSDDELLKVLAGGEQEYVPEALAAARDEYNKRAIPETKLEEAKVKHTIITQIEDNNAKVRQETATAFVIVKLVLLIVTILGGILIAVFKMP